MKSSVPQPKLALCSFVRVQVASGQTAKVTLDIPLERLRYWDVNAKKYVVEPGDYELLIGAVAKMSADYLQGDYKYSNRLELEYSHSRLRPPGQPEVKP